MEKEGIINRKVSRRKFVLASMFTGLIAAMPKWAFPFKSTKSNSKVVIVEDQNATSGATVDATVAQSMVDHAIKELTGITNVGDAWKSLMPGITSSSVIAIKINCRAEALPTHPEVTYAVTNGLAQMQIDGNSFPENNIHIYDNYKAYLTEAGYTENTSSVGVQCYQTGQNDHANQIYSVNGINQKVCTLLHDTADYLINIGVLKNHYSMAGVTLCLKNHFGSIDDPHAMHINCGDPYIGALNAIDPIKNKSVVCVLDALLGAAEGGPYGAPTFVENKILMSTDPVAIDYLGREILIDHNSSTVSMATYIDSAANYGIGTNDPNQMDIVNITNPTYSFETIDENVPVNIKNNYPNPFSESTTLEFSLNKTQLVNISIYNALGVKVLTLVDDTILPGNYSYQWNGDNGNGTKVQKGLYVATFIVGDYKKSLAMVYR